MSRESRLFGYYIERNNDGEISVRNLNPNVQFKVFSNEKIVKWGNANVEINDFDLVYIIVTLENYLAISISEFIGNKSIELYFNIIDISKIEKYGLNLELPNNVSEILKHCIEVDINKIIN